MFASFPIQQQWVYIILTIYFSRDCEPVTNNLLVVSSFKNSDYFSYKQQEQFGLKKWQDVQISFVGRKNTQLHQSEVTKMNTKPVGTFGKTMLDSVLFPGPQPKQTSVDMFNCMSLLNLWLTKQCPENDMGFVDKWQNNESHAFHVQPGGSPTTVLSSYLLILWEILPGTAESHCNLNHHSVKDCFF